MEKCIIICWHKLFVKEEIFKNLKMNSYLSCHQTAHFPDNHAAFVLHFWSCCIL